MINQFLWLALGLFCLPSWADDIFKEPMSLERVESDYVQSEDDIWKEMEAKLPEYPEDGDLLELRIDQPKNRFEYHIDTKSLSVGEDGVTRYSMAITSKSGARNVLYEALYCDTREYKTYAFGSKGRFRRVRTPVWKGLQEARGAMSYRIDLVDFYMCNQFSAAYQPKQVISRIKASKVYDVE